MKLAGPDINAGNMTRTRLKQDLNETAGRSANIKAGLSRHIHIENIQRALQLQGRAADIGVEVFGLDTGPFGNRKGCFQDCLAINPDLAALNGGAGPRPAFELTAFGQIDVQTGLAHRAPGQRRSPRRLPHHGPARPAHS